MPDKKATIIELDVHRRKLSRLVGDLLKKADELDVWTKENQRKLDAKWHDELATLCHELASLSEAAGAIEKLIKANNVKKSEDSLLRSARIANHLSEKLNELKRQAGQ